MRYKCGFGRVYKISLKTFRMLYMNYDDKAVHQSSYVSGASMKRMMAALAFLFGRFAAELAGPINCKLIHRSAARQLQRRQQELS